MSASYLIHYEGKPADPEAFFRYYVDEHLPLVWGFPRIRRIEIMRAVDDADLFMITRLVFDTVEDLKSAVTSDHRGVTKADMDNFPQFHGTVRWFVVENYQFEHPTA